MGKRSLHRHLKNKHDIDQSAIDHQHDVEERKRKNEQKN